MNCDHPEPELCELLGRHIHGRLWEIWLGVVLTPEKCEAYRESWMASVGLEQLPMHLAPSVLIRREGMRKFAGAAIDWSKFLKKLSDVDRIRRETEWKEYNSSNWQSYFDIDRLKRFEALIHYLLESKEIEIKGPSLMRKVGNFTTAVVADVKAGRPRVIDAERIRRLELCLDCSFYDPTNGACKHPTCGCNMSLKTWWAGSECPIERWGQINDTELIK